MAQIHTKQEYLQKIEELRAHNRHYYDEHSPIISDYEYDQLYRSVIDCERAHPTWIDPHSPTQQLQEAAGRGFQQREHREPMLSLANTYSEEEVIDFVERVKKLLGRPTVAFVTELKMDGVAISLTYRNGQLMYGVTRGDGRVGDDVTLNVRTIPELPSACKMGVQEMEIRGEVYLALDSFRSLNQQREEEGLELFANPRNAAAGSLKLLDPREVTKRRLHLMCYGVAESGLLAPTQIETLQCLKKMGFPTAPDTLYARCTSPQEILQFAERIHAQRDQLPFEIDGIVVKVDDLTTYKQLGATGKTPRYAVAYKFAPEQAITQVKRIVVQVGRTGVLTPVAELTPVSLAGSVIARATLHNQEEVERKEIREGDFVVIEKGGDVIPKVVRVDMGRRPPGTRPWKMVHECPLCHSKVIHRPGEVAVRCPNLQCSGQVTRRLIHFASRSAMDIQHLGEKVVEELVTHGFVRSCADLYQLTPEMLSSLEGFKEKSIHNLLEGIAASKKSPLYRLIVGLGIRHVGIETAILLAEAVGDVPSLLALTPHALKQLEGVGEKTAASLLEFLSDPLHREEIERLWDSGVRPEQTYHKGLKPWAGKHFVMTGTLEHYTREEAAALIQERGGKVSNTVGQKTNYVLVGTDPGSKLAKAKELGVVILSEEEFLKMLRIS